MTEPKKKGKAPGGKRKGAGRPIGARNKVTAEQLQSARDGGMLPLEYMLTIMRDSKAPTERRDDMAKSAAPYLHPRLASMQATVNVQMTHEQALKDLAADDEDDQGK
jgi:hypothetical protein